MVLQAKHQPNFVSRNLGSFANASQKYREVYSGLRALSMSTKNIFHIKANDFYTCTLFLASYPDFHTRT